MELRTLHYFTVVAQELNITRAAEKLNMSQPPLSNQIKALEEELGVQLFIRGKRHLELTEEGGLLLRRAVQIQELADTTRQEIASLREGMTTPNTWRAFPWGGNPGLLCFTQTIPWPRRWETPFPYPAWQGSR